MKNTEIINNTLSLLRRGPVWVCGAGVAGKGCIALLDSLGIQCTVVDDNTEAIRWVKQEFSSDYLTVDEAYQTLISGENTPGMLVTSPGWSPATLLLTEAESRSIPIIGDIELAWVVDQSGEKGTPRTWIAITGTNGKTTTTEMTTAIVKADGKSVKTVGNIGASACEALLEEHVDYFVAEVSSFQLHWTYCFSPHVGCVLNIAEDHLDWHGSLENYVVDKIKVLKADYQVLALDDHCVIQEVENNTCIPSAVRSAFSIATNAHAENLAEILQRYSLKSIVTLENSSDLDLLEITSSEKTLLSEDISQLSPPGPAGQLDAAAAAAMARAVGVGTASIADALANFSVAPHRGEIVLDKDAIRWIDNSKATNPHAAQAALQGLDTVIWIAGGQLKGADVTSLIQNTAAAMKAVVLLGQDRHIIAEALAQNAPELPVEIIDEIDPIQAMNEVIIAVQKHVIPGAQVVLAPAAASLDMYNGMAQRGEMFAQSIHALVLGDEHK